jgi:hypothetical protein
MGVCRPCSVTMFAPRLGAAAAAAATVVVGSHALVGAGRNVRWVRGRSGLGVGALAIERGWRRVGVAGGLVAASVRSVVGRVVGDVGCDRWCGDVGVHGR